MTRIPPISLAAVALLALPGCSGWVIVEEAAPTMGLFSVSQSPSDQALASARFQKMTGEGAPDWWSEVDHDGACRLIHYEQPTPGSKPPAQLDAGELRVKGGLKELVADYDDGYEFAPETAIFEAGDVLELDIEGTDRVAAMSVSLPAPPVPVIALPPETIDGSKDLTFTWTSPPGAGRLTIQVGGSWPAVEGATGKVWYARDSVSCEVDPSQGTLTMPASLLSQVVTDASVGLSIFATVKVYERRYFGDSFVGFLVGTTAATPSGNAYSLTSKLK